MSFKQPPRQAGFRVQWKSFQRDTATRRRISLAILALSILAVFIAAGRLLSFISRLNNPLSPDSLSFVKTYRWDGNSTINLVVGSYDKNRSADPIYVLSFDPTNSTLTTLKLPPDTYLELPYGFGRWPVRSIYQLGQQENLPMGAKLLKETITYSFNTPIDNYLLLNETGELSRNFFDGLRFLGGVKTDLTIVEYLKLIRGLSKVRNDKVKLVDLGQSEITESVLLSDGTRGLGINVVKLDQLLRTKFIDVRLSDEDKSIGIYNSTSHPGLAEKAGKVITNMGGRVIFTSNSKIPLKDSLVVGESSYTKLRLSEVFAPYCVSVRTLFWLKGAGNCDINKAEDKEVVSSRAQTNLILGEDYFLKFNSR